MKIKVSACVLLFTLFFLFADSQYKILFFEEKPNSRGCSLIDNLKELSIALESGNTKEIDLGIKKVRFNLTIAYGLETGLPGLESKSDSGEVSQLSKDLDTARKEFDKFSALEESEITRKIPLVESSLKKTQDLLKSYC
jgi:hypothetical protein